MNCKKCIVLPALVLFCLLTAGTLAVVQAATGEATPSRAYLHAYNLPASGVALDGYCPVSYFVLDRAVKGHPEHSSEYDGVTYRFASAEGKAAFDRDPVRYLPAYGGWCAFGMAIEDKFPIDPTNFKIVDGQLMLFLRNANVDALTLWDQGDEREQVQKANDHWNNVRG